MNVPGSKVLHLDMDSFFAGAEQQARPSLRGRPVGISIAPSKGGTIIAASIEAKKYGVGTGTKVGIAKELIPDLVLLRPDPPRYRAVHRRVRTILNDYSDVVRPRSIDEMSMWLTPDLLRGRTPAEVGAEIKQRIRDEVGEWLSSSAGIGANWFLAKTGSSFDKPDGLVEITPDNTREILGQLKLRDLCGIARRMEARMHLVGIASPTDLYDLPPWDLKRRLGIIGYYWYLRVHGYSIDTEDHPRRTLGHSSVIPRPTRSLLQLKPLLTKLCERAGRRLRHEGLLASGVAIY
jgi:DNA polymerase-4